MVVISIEIELIGVMSGWLETGPPLRLLGGSSLGGRLRVIGVIGRRLVLFPVFGGSADLVETVRGHKMVDVETAV
jgi:hypothetical protein